MTHDFSTQDAEARKDEKAVSVIELESFAVFDEWMDKALDELVGRWAHTAAPNAQRASLLQPRMRGNAF
jgi:hypothetical protein